MPPFKDDQIIIIAPGSQTTLAQVGLPESFTPAKLRVKSRMFPAEKEGEWEPYRVRKVERKNGTGQTAAANPNVSQEEVEEIKEMGKSLGETEEEVAYEEDHVTDEGAVWPIVEGRIVNWPCFYALMTHVYNTLNPPFHTPILLIAQPCWTPREHEKLTQFFFERFKTPAFAIMDSALASMYAFGISSATVVDIGFEKADVTAISDFLVHDIGRAIALEGCGGESFTQRLMELLKHRGFTREMCEQLKRSPICEILPVGTPLPGADGPQDAANPAAAASTGATASGPGNRETAGAMGTVPLGPGPDTQVGEEPAGEDNEGVLDVASIVARGNMTEFLARKEKEKQEKAAAKKKGAEAAATAATAAKPVRLPNSKREKNTFVYEDHALLDTLKNMNLGSEQLAEARAVLDEGAGTAQPGTETTGGQASGTSTTVNGQTIRREIEVGIERFQAASGGTLERIADAMHRVISAVEEVNKRSELWENIIIVGNGAKIRGFRDALLSILQTKYLISPSSATIFTSELPSNLSTPTGTGANTPQPQSQLGPHGGASNASQVNPLLLAATTSNAHMQTPGFPTAPGTPGGSHQHQGPTPQQQQQHHSHHSSHGQTPTAIKYVKQPDYFPEWKEAGFDEAVFLGAQVAAKVVFIVDAGGGGGGGGGSGANNQTGKAYMTRPDYNEQGPAGIHEYVIM